MNKLLSYQRDFSKYCVNMDKPNVNKVALNEERAVFKAFVLTVLRVKTFCD